MGKYTDRRKEVHVEKDLTKSPVWKGIGCVLMIVIPTIAFTAASLTVNSDGAAGFLPPILVTFPTLPEFVFKLQPNVQALFLPITGIYGFYGIIVIGIAYTILLGSVVSFLYAILMRTLGPGTASPFDAPRPNRKAKKYTR